MPEYTYIRSFPINVTALEEERNNLGRENMQLMKENAELKIKLNLLEIEVKRLQNKIAWLHHDAMMHVEQFTREGPQPPNGV